MTTEERLEKLERELAETKDGLTTAKRLIRRMKIGEAIFFIGFFVLPLVISLIMWIIDIVKHGW